MLKIGIQSGGIFSLDNPDAGMKTLSAHGFEFVDLNIDQMLPSDQIFRGKPEGFFSQSDEEISGFFAPVREASEKYGVAVSQMHAPFPFWVKGRDDMNKYVIESIKKCFKVAKYLGCGHMVVHPADIQYIYDKKTEIRINLEIYESLIESAVENGVQICLENLFAAHRGYCMEGPCSDASEITYYIDKLNEKAGSEVFGFCLDIGHANLLGRNFREYIKTIGKRISILHIHDNDGRADLHLLPYCNTENWGRTHCMDWKGFIAGLKETGYNGTLSFETFRCMGAFPSDVHPELLDLIFAIGRYFGKCISGE